MIAVGVILILNGIIGISEMPELSGLLILAGGALLAIGSVRNAIKNKRQRQLAIRRANTVQPRVRNTMDERLGYQWAFIKKTALERSSGRCARCGKSTELDVHHIKPRSLGGTDTLDNVVVLCKSCHHLIHSNANPEHARHISTSRISSAKKKELITRAIAESRSIRFIYTKSDGTRSTRHVRPVQFYSGANRGLYLRSFDLERRAERRFKISRMSDLSISSA